TVSISSVLPTNQHNCVSDCLACPYNYICAGIGKGLSCAKPYMNNCFCATESSWASQASSFITACASSSCSAGDVSFDITAMQSMYQSYCMNSGFTQPGGTNWYT
ncbi:hypothetical protein GQ53DRAFT_619148, partial [Thozetella sp. PMI_491]